MATSRPAPFRIPNGRVSAGRRAISKARGPGSTPSARSVNATARINKMAEYIAQHTTAEWLERLDAADVPAPDACAAARSFITNKWSRAALLRRSISQWSDGCGSRSRRRSSQSTRPPSAGLRPASASTRAKCWRSRLRRRRHRQDGQRKIDPGGGLIRSGFLLHRNARRQRIVRRLGELIGRSRLDAFEIWLCVVAEFRRRKRSPNRGAGRCQQNGWRW